MKLPEWAKWLARDEDGTLGAYMIEPFKDELSGIWVLKADDLDKWEEVDETDDTFEDILWTDDEPVKVADYGEHLLERAESLKEMCDALNRNWEAEHGKPSVAEYNQWQITQAKAHGYDEPPVMSDYDMVTKPKHYIGMHGLEVEEVLQNFLPKITDGYVAHRVGSLIEYVLRHPEKNGYEDLEKAQRNLKQVFDYYNLKG